MLRKNRVKYYNAFSHVYDKFIAMHSKDLQQKARNFLITTVNPREGDTIIDICTGTGSLLPLFAERVKESGRVLGIDFSIGMLRVARAKTRHLENVSLVLADVSALPVRAECADAMTCSHAFYELKGETADACLKEVRRILKKDASFFMMEHEVPRNRFVRGLYYLRLLSMGSDRMKEILENETGRFKAVFKEVKKTVSPTGKSKILISTKKSEI